MSRRQRTARQRKGLIPLRRIAAAQHFILDRLPVRGRDDIRVQHDRALHVRAARRLLELNRRKARLMHHPPDLQDLGIRDPQRVRPHPRQRQQTPDLQPQHHMVQRHTRLHHFCAVPRPRQR